MSANATLLEVFDPKIASTYADGGTNGDSASYRLKRPFPRMEVTHRILRVIQFLVLLAVVSMEAFIQGCPRMHLVNVLFVRKQFLIGEYPPLLFSSG